MENDGLGVCAVLRVMGGNAEGSQLGLGSRKGPAELGRRTIGKEQVLRTGQILCIDSKFIGSQLVHC